MPLIPTVDIGPFDGDAGQALDLFDLIGKGVAVMGAAGTVEALQRTPQLERIAPIRDVAGRDNPIEQGSLIMAADFVEFSSTSDWKQAASGAMHSSDWDRMDMVRNRLATMAELITDFIRAAPGRSVPPGAIIEIEITLRERLRSSA